MTMDGNKEAEFMRLFVACEPELRAFLRTLLPTWEAVDDVLQEASVVMWKKLDQLEDEQGFLPWAKVIVRFKAQLEYRGFTPLQYRVRDDQKWGGWTACG